VTDGRSTGGPSGARGAGPPPPPAPAPAGRPPARSEQTAGRRPLPALICLVALTLLTALVWWRVLERGSPHAASTPTACPTVSSHALPRPTSVTVTVLNSTTRSGLAKTTAAALAKLGFTTSYANDTGHAAIAGVAEIRFGQDEKDAAATLNFYFPGATQVPLGANSAGKLVVSLGTQFHAVQTETQVAAAMSSAHVSLAPKSFTTATATPTC